LPEERIREIVSNGIKFLRFILRKTDYVPISFRAGNWLFQPTQPAARILCEYGIKIDSSVFKGGGSKNMELTIESQPEWILLEILGRCGRA